MITLHSCEEEVDDPANTTSDFDLVKTRTAYGETSTYTYDAQGRITREDDSDGSYSTVTYGTGQLTFASFDSTGQAYGSYVYQTNSDGYVVSGQGGTYTYNSDGRLLSTSYTDSTQTFTTTNEYTDGNLTRSSRSTTDYTTYTYLTDKVETRMEGTQTLLGKPSYNLVSTSSEHYDGQTPYTNTYTYDSQGRVSTQTRTESGGSTPDVTSYTYFD